MSDVGTGEELPIRVDWGDIKTAPQASDPKAAKREADKRLREGWGADLPESGPPCSR